MGWARLFLLGNVGQQFDIQDLADSLQELDSQVATQRRRSKDTHAQIKQLEIEVAELRLYLAATMRLLRDKQVLSMAEIQDMIDAVDLEDGQADGQHRGKV